MASTQAAFQALQPTRAQLAKVCGSDQAILRMFERLFALTSSTNAGVPVTEDVALDADGLNLAVQLDVGRHYVELTALLVVVGGSPGNGWSVSEYGTALLAAGSWFTLVVTPAATVADHAARPLTPITGDAAEMTVIVRGYVAVTQRGTLGFTAALDGAPTSATLISGSGIMTTPVREFST